MVYKKLKTPKKLYFRKIKIYLKTTVEENMFFKRKFGIKSDCYVFISATDEKKARLAFTADKKRYRKQRKSLLENIWKYKSKKFKSAYCNRAKVELKFFEDHPELSVAYVLDNCRRKGISLHKFMSCYVRQKRFNLMSDDSKLLEVINDIKQIHSQETNLRDCSTSRSNYSAGPWEDSFSKKDDTNTGTQEDSNVKILRRNKRPFDQIGIDMESTHLQNDTQLVGNTSKTRDPVYQLLDDVVRDILAMSISPSKCSNINENMHQGWELAQYVDNLDQGVNGYDIHSTESSLGSQKHLFSDNETKLDKVQVTDDSPVHLKATDIKSTHDVGLLATDDSTLSNNFGKIGLQGEGFQTVDDCNIHSTETSEGPQNSCCSENGTEFNEVQETDDGSLYLKVPDHKPTLDLGPLATDEYTLLKKFGTDILRGGGSFDDSNIHSTETSKGPQNPCYSVTALNEVQVTDDGSLHVRATDIKSTHDVGLLATVESTLLKKFETYIVRGGGSVDDCNIHSTETSKGPQNPCYSEDETEFNEVQVTDDGSIHIEPIHDVGALATDDSTDSESFSKHGVRGGYQGHSSKTCKRSQSPCYSENETELNKVQVTADGPIHLNALVKCTEPTHDIVTLATDDSTDSESFRKNSLRGGFQEHSTETNKGPQDPCYSRKETVYRLCINEAELDNVLPDLKVTNIGLAHDVDPLGSSVCTPCNSNVESKILDCIIRGIESTYDSPPHAGSLRASGDSTIYTELTEDYIPINDMYSSFDGIYQGLKQKGKLNPAFPSPRNLSIEEILAVAKQRATDKQDASLDVYIFKMTDKEPAKDSSQLDDPVSIDDSNINVSNDDKNLSLFPDSSDANASSSHMGKETHHVGAHTSEVSSISEDCISISDKNIEEYHDLYFANCDFGCFELVTGSISIFSLDI